MPDHGRFQTPQSVEVSLFPGTNVEESGYTPTSYKPQYDGTNTSERGSGTVNEARPVKSFIIVRGSYSDVSFALAGMVKQVCPYPGPDKGNP
jgi:hypothetical protein